MTYNEYKFLKELYKMDKEINDKQKYKAHFVSDIAKQTSFTEIQVLTFAKSLCQKDFVDLVNNTPESGGYIHCVGITYSGVTAKNDYYTHVIKTFVWSILVPAIVSVICSCIVANFV